MQELARIFVNRWRLLFLLLCIVVNGAYFWRSQDVEEGKAYYKAYQDYINEYKNMPLDQWNGIVEQWQEESELQIGEEYAAVNLSVQEITYNNIMREMSGTAEYLSGYEKRYEEMKNRAGQMKKFAIFRQSGSVSLRNIEQEVQDFEKVSKVSVKLTQDKAIRAWESFHLPDYLLILFEMIIVIAFFEERNKGLSGMVRASAGRNPLVWKRTGILALTAAIGSAILYGMNLYLSVKIYGKPDWGNALQCLPHYGKCPYLMNIREYMILHVCYKALCLFGIACLFWLAMMLISQTTIAIITMAVFMCIQYVIYSNMGDLHPLAVCKYINVFGFLNPSQALQNYLNVQVWGGLAEIWKIHRTALPVLTVILAGSCILAGCTLREPVVKNIKLIPGKILAKVGFAWESPSLIRQEGYKYFWVHGGLFLLVGIAVYLYVSFAPSYEMYDEMYLYVKEYYQTLEGELTPQKEEYIAEEENRIQKQLDELDEAYRLGKDERVLEYYVQMRERILLHQEAIGEIRSECERLKELQISGIKAYFVEPYGYEAVFGKSSVNNNEKLLLFILIVPLLSAGSFAYENQCSARGTIRASAAGRKKVYGVKWGWTLAGTLILWVMFCVREWMQARIQYDFPDRDASIQNLALFADCHGNISISTGLILLYVGRLFVMLVMTWIAVQISKRCHNVRNAYVISCLVLVLPAAFVTVGAWYIEKLSFLKILRFGEYLVKWLNMC